MGTSGEGASTGWAAATGVPAATSRPDADGGAGWLHALARELDATCPSAPMAAARLCQSIRAAGVADAAGVYFNAGDSLVLVANEGLPPGLAAAVARFGPSTPHAALVRTGRPVFAQLAEVARMLGEPPDGPLWSCGLAHVGVLPLPLPSDLWGCLNVACVPGRDWTATDRGALLSAAALLGSLTAAPAGLTAVRAAAPPPGVRGRVIVVEDHEALAQCLVTSLARWGLHGDLVGSLAELAAHLPAALPLDLLILDHKLPDGLGSSLGPRLREMQPDLPIIYLSGMPRHAIDLGRLGVPTAFLQKPFRLEHLHALVTLLLRETPAGRA